MITRNETQEIIDSWYSSFDTKRHVTEHGIPLRGERGQHLPVFVKLSNLGPYRRLVYTTVHIEVEGKFRPYGGDSLTLCGKRLGFGRYFWPQEWRPEYHTCKTCHKFAQSPELMAGLERRLTAKMEGKR